MINARFLKRLFAFLIDTLIVFILSTIIYSMLNGIFNFNTSETNKYIEEITEIVNEMDKLDSGMENEEDIEKSYELLDQITEKSKDNFKVITMESIPNTMVTFVIQVLYYIILCFYMKGQTLGKKLLNIKIVDNNGNAPSVNKLIIRSIILNGLYATIIDSFMVFILDNNGFYNLHLVVNTFTIVIVLISSILIIFNDDRKGIHDKVAKTKVVIDE